MLKSVLVRGRQAGRRRRAAGLAVLGGVTVLAAAYLGDPVHGRRRRDMLSAMLRHGGRRLRRAGRHATAEARGAAERALHRRPGPAADERTLLDRLRSELFADPTIPGDRLTLDIEKGVLVLRGELATREEIRRIETRARRLHGVPEVESLLHVTGTPAPNKAAALRASTVAEWREEG